MFNWICTLINNHKQKVAERDMLCEQYIAKTSQVENALISILQQHSDQIVSADDNQVILNKTKKFLKDVELQSVNLRKAKSIKSFRKHINSLRNTINNFPAMIKQHNAAIWQSRINDVSNTIGNVEGNPLDNQQLLCIAKNERNHLVLAGAGTGKTTTIVGKIKYILNKRWLEPQDILVLSFTNASAAEMNERIKKETGQNIDASTFHKLGLNILTKANGIVPKISNLDVKKFIKECLEQNMKNPGYYNKLATYLFFHRVAAKSEFDFKSIEEYNHYLQLNPPKTVNEETVKSYGELEIANFLYQNGIRYKYEADYAVDTRDEEHSQYKPDFYLLDYDIYIEYFGIDRMGNVPPFFSGKNGIDAKSAYNQSIEWKRKTHAENNTKMIECFAYEKLEGHLLETLQENLLKHGVKLNPMSTDELWNHVCKDDKHILDGLVDLFETIISLIKSNRLSINDVRALNTFGYGYAANKTILDLIEPIFNAYQLHLVKNNMIDFNDMINCAIDAVNAHKYVHNYKLVIVDEYQDISKQRFLLLDSMRKQRGYDLFCVGDDWQSIYRFAGSDIGFILDFAKYWGPTEISKIETTYRFSQSLIDVSGSFVMTNPDQIKKNIKGKSPSVGFSVGEIQGYTEEYAMKFVATRLADLPQNSSVFFIGRYTCDVNMLEDSKLFNCKYNNVTGVVDVVYNKRKDLKMSFITAHKSKGLQADYVFIINNKKGRMGFPSEIQNAPILELLLEGYGDYPFAEERRLFYVALTRARKKALLVTLANRESIFTKELQSKYGDRMRKEAFECPLCGASLEKKKGPYGEFFGCSNYRKTGCKFTRKIQTFKE
jgi:DNA helicase-4